MRSVTRRDADGGPLSAALTGLLVGAAVGLGEAIVLHHFSLSPDRDRLLFLQGAALYGAAGAVLMAALSVLLRRLRLGSLIVPPHRALALAVALFAIMELREAGLERGDYRVVTAYFLSTRPRLAWTLAMGGLFVLLFPLFATLFRFLLRPRRLASLLGGRGRLLLIAALVVAASTASLMASSREGPTSERNNVLLIVMDTTRFDALSCNVLPDRRAESVKTPHLDRVGSEGIRFTRAYAPSPWTLPSHAGLFTGLHMAQHGASLSFPQLHGDYNTLAELLRDQGYQTIGFSNNSGYVKKAFGFAQGFHQFIPVWEATPYKELALRPLPDKPRLRLLALLPERLAGQAPTDLGPHAYTDAGARRTTVMAARWMERLAAAGSRRPWFMFINFMEPHGPYRPVGDGAPALTPRTFADPDAQTIWDDLTGSRKDHMTPDWGRKVAAAYQRYRRGEVAVEPGFEQAIRDRYNAEVTYLDAEIGRLLTFMRETGRLDNTVLIITSDHGENFGENGHWLHNNSVQDTLLHVPLLIRAPGVSPAVRTDPVGLTQIYPTVAELTVGRLAAPGQILGRSLLKEPEPKDAFAMAQYRFTSRPTHLALAKAWHARLARDAFPAADGQGDEPKMLTLLRDLATLDLETDAGKARLIEIADWMEANRSLVPSSSFSPPRVVSWFGPWKYVWQPFQDEMLFNLEQDPTEKQNRYYDRATDPVADAAYHRLRKRLLEAMEPMEPADIRRALQLGPGAFDDARGLGYNH